jgi:apolipoprotein N-acyltransferase
VSRLRWLFETLVLAGIFALAYRFPGALGGWLEVIATFAFPALLFESVFRGRNLAYSYLALFLGLIGIFHWMPATLESKGGLGYPMALLGAGLFWAFEAGGFIAVIAFTRWMHKRGGALAAAFGAALGLVIWEAYGFHIYQWSWGSALGALPWTARGAAFLSTYGYSALIWGVAAWTGAQLASNETLKSLRGPVCLYATLFALNLGWFALPHQTPHQIDVVMVQPNFPPGVRQPGMEARGWELSDAALAQHQLPRADRPTLLLWAESSVLGQDHRGADARLQNEAQRRKVAWLFGTEGGLLNLVRGEVAGRPSFIQGKTEPMPFGERMPGPEPMRRWLDQRMGFISQEPGELSERSVFIVPQGKGELRIHPLICSEALMAERSRQGLALTRADLLTNHTNDGWFDRSPASRLHAVQIRLRAIELGVPLLRSTLTGLSGAFHEDGHFELMGEAMSQGTYAFELRWSPRTTPARSAWVLRGLLLVLLALNALLAFRKRSRA